MTILGTSRNRQYEAGIRYFDHGQYDLAVKELRYVLHESETATQAERKLAQFYLGEALASLAEEHLQQQCWTAAEEHLREAAQINPGYADLHYQLARICYLTGRLGDGAAELSAALEINPRFARAIFLEGLLRYRQQDRETGIRRMTEAAELDETLRTPEMEAALEMDRLGEHAEALERFTRVGEMTVDEVADLIHSARTSLGIGDVERAERSAREALRMKPGYPDVRNLMGQVYMAKGEWLRAVNQFKAALSANPKFVAATLNLGKACRSTGNEDAARSAFKQVLSLDPDNEEARGLLSRK